MSPPHLAKRSANLCRSCFACGIRLPKFNANGLLGLEAVRGNPPTKLSQAQTNASWAVGKLRVRRPLLRACKLGRKTLTFTWDAVGGTSIENHPLEKCVVIYVLLGPGGAQAAGAAALLLAQFGFIQDLAAAVFCLAEPAIPSCGETGVGRWASERRGSGREAVSFRGKETLRGWGGSEHGGGGEREEKSRK